jgi:hypothetical protein
VRECVCACVRARVRARMYTVTASDWLRAGRPRVRNSSPGRVKVSSSPTESSAFTPGVKRCGRIYLQLVPK